jgi:hypothetical protein
MTDKDMPLKLNAYYYRFRPTGNRDIDLILQAVAMAGKGAHHTEHWYGDGYVEKIQEAANNAANTRPDTAKDDVGELINTLPIGDWSWSIDITKEDNQFRVCVFEQSDYKSAHHTLRGTGKTPAEAIRAAMQKVGG